LSPRSAHAGWHRVGAPRRGWRRWELRGDWGALGWFPDRTGWTREYVPACPIGDAAGCSRSVDGLVPGESCGCGVHAWPTRGRALAGSGEVYGECELAGKVIESAKGELRAERATILRLFWKHEAQREEVECIAAGLGVPVKRCPFVLPPGSQKHRLWALRDLSDEELEAQEASWP
jgi:hypothetical protein